MLLKHNLIFFFAKNEIHSGRKSSKISQLNLRPKLTKKGVNRNHVSVIGTHFCFTPSG